VNLYFFPRYSRLGASSRLRFYSIYDYLEKDDQNGEVFISPFFPDSYLKKKYKSAPNIFVFPIVLFSYIRRIIYILLNVKKESLIIIEKELLPFFPSMFESYLYKAKNCRIIIDYDDAVFLNYEKGFFRKIFYGRKIYKILSYSDFYIFCSSFLGEKFQALDLNFEKIMTVPDSNFFNLTEIDIPLPLQKNYVVWSGSPSSFVYLERIVHDLLEGLKKFDCALVIIGAKPEFENENLYSYNWNSETENFIIKNAKVGIMPLDDSDWSNGKCGFKIIKYMSHSIPVIASPIGENNKIIEDYKNGFFADNVQDFISITERLLNDEKLFKKISQNSFLQYQKLYTPEIYLKKYLNVINRVKENTLDALEQDIISSFGVEWGKFQYLSKIYEMEKYFHLYFNLVFKSLSRVKLSQMRCIDFGSGSGRWDYFLSDYVKSIDLIEPSKTAIESSKLLLESKSNIDFYNHTIGGFYKKNKGSKYDLAISLGVLHHVPRMDKSLDIIAKVVKPGGYFLGYLYYSLEHQSHIKKMLFKLVSIIRLLVSKLPEREKNFVTDAIALLIYLPLARIAKITGIKALPLSFYANSSFYILRNDARDRFGTFYENRFSKLEIEKMMSSAGFENIQFFDGEPKWCFIARKSK